MIVPELYPPTIPTAAKQKFNNHLTSEPVAAINEILSTLMNHEDSEAPISSCYKMTTQSPVGFVHDERIIPSNNTPVSSHALKRVTSQMQAC